MINKYQDLLVVILNIVGKATTKISERSRNIVIQLIWIVIAAIFVVARSMERSNSLLWHLFPTIDSRHLLLSVLVLLAAILSINNPIHKVRWRGIVMIPQIILGIIILCISFVHPVGGGYRLFGLQLLILFPIFYLIWNNRRDYTQLFKPIVYAVTLVGLVVFVVAFSSALHGELGLQGSRCSGPMINANCYCLIGLEMILGAVYIFLTDNKGVWKWIYSSIVMGAGLGMILSGQMRIALLTVIVCPLVSIYYLLRFKVKVNNEKASFLRVLNIILTFVIVLQFSMNIIGTNEHAIAKANKAAQITVEEQEEKTPGIVNRLNPTNKDSADAYMSGRIRIWGNYAKELNLLGNSYDTNKAEELTGIKGLPYAHNLFLEVAYRCGIPAGIIYVLFLLACGLVCLRILFSKEGEKKAYHIFPIIAVIVFTLEAVFDCAVLPFFQIEDLMFYVSVSVLADVRE